MLKNYPNIKNAVINDINTDLTDTYENIKRQPQALIQTLERFETLYFSYTSGEERKNFYLEKRAEYNTRNSKESVVDSLYTSALMIFLNRTCFNGLYRVNSKNEFNVPFGKYTNPRICDAHTILADSAVLQRVKVLNGDFEETLKYASTTTFFYFDPPYKALTQTASFNSYAREGFNDQAQKRLKDFCEHLHQNNYLWLLSNSDVKNSDSGNHFFDDLYAGYYITRVKAKRAINSNSLKRGEINELLITNYT
jgi:DNA adenine methylase